VRFINFELTRGNVADNNADVVKKLTDNIFGLLFGDKGYIGTEKRLQKKEYKNHSQKIRKNMEEPVLTPYEKFLLKKRGVVESVIGILKEKLSLENSRHRSIWNFLSHICSCLTAYFFTSKKPCITGIKENLIAA